MHWTLIDCWEKIGGGRITLCFFHERNAFGAVCDATNSRKRKGGKMNVGI